MSDIASELGSSGYLMVAFPAGKAEFSDEMAGELRALIGNDCQDRRDDRQDRRRGPRLFRNRERGNGDEVSIQQG
jgi:hypothetical protein